MEHTVYSDIKNLKSLSLFLAGLCAAEQNPQALLTPFGPYNLQFTRSSLSHTLTNIRTAIQKHHNTLLSPPKPESQLSLTQNSYEDDSLKLKKTLNAFKDQSSASLKVNLLYGDLSYCESELLLAIFANTKKRLLKCAKQNALTNLIWKDYFMRLCEKLGLTFYEDGPTKFQEPTTLTLCGEIFVLDIEVNSKSKISKATVSYDMIDSHDGKIDELLQRYLQEFNLELFEINLTSLSQMDWLSRSFGPTNFFLKTLGVASKLKEFTAVPDKPSKMEIVGAINNNNGMLMENLIFQGASLMFRITPAVYQSLEDDEFCNIFNSGNTTHWSFGYSNIMWFGWENKISTIQNLNPNSERINASFLKSSSKLQSQEGEKQTSTNMNTDISTTNTATTEPGANADSISAAAAAAAAVADVGSDTEIEPGTSSEANEKSEPKSNDNELDQLAANSFVPVVRFQPYIWCSQQTIDAIRKCLFTDSMEEPNIYKFMSSIAHSTDERVGQSRFLESLACRDSLISEQPPSFEDFTMQVIPEEGTVLVFEKIEPKILGYALCRAPITQMGALSKLLPVIRRQVVFNDLISSGFSIRTQEPNITENYSRYNVKIETHNSYPFSIMVNIAEVDTGSIRVGIFSDQEYLGIENNEEESKNKNAQKHEVMDTLLLKVSINGRITVIVVKQSKLQTKKASENGMIGEPKIDTRFDSTGAAGMDVDTVANIDSNWHEKLSDIANKSCDIPVIVCKWLSLQNL